MKNLKTFDQFINEGNYIMKDFKNTHFDDYPKGTKELENIPKELAQKIYKKFLTKNDENHDFNELYSLAKNSKIKTYDWISIFHGSPKEISLMFSSYNGVEIDLLVGPKAAKEVQNFLDKA